MVPINTTQEVPHDLSNYRNLFITFIIFQHVKENQNVRKMFDTEGQIDLSEAPLFPLPLFKGEPRFQQMLILPASFLMENVNHMYTEV